MRGGRQLHDGRQLVLRGVQQRVLSWRGFAERVPGLLRRPPLHERDLVRLGHHLELHGMRGRIIPGGRPSQHVPALHGDRQLHHAHGMHFGNDVTLLRVRAWLLSGRWHRDHRRHVHGLRRLVRAGPIRIHRMLHRCESRVHSMQRGVRNMHRTRGNPMRFVSRG